MLSAVARGCSEVRFSSEITGAAVFLTSQCRIDADVLPTLYSGLGIIVWLDGWCRPWHRNWLITYILQSDGDCDFGSIGNVVRLDVHDFELKPL